MKIRMDVDGTRIIAMLDDKDFAYSRGLVKLGTIESGARAFERSGRLRVTIGTERGMSP